VIVSQAAARDLARLHEFLMKTSPSSAKQASRAIKAGIRQLAHAPEIGRLIEGLPPMFREWIIDFGHSGYIARYVLNGDEIVVLAIWHQKEAGR